MSGYRYRPYPRAVGHPMRPTQLSYPAVDEKGRMLQGSDEYVSLQEYDAQSRLIYFGKATPGTPTGEARWQIRKMEYDANSNLTAIKWADGNQSFDNVWDNRTSLSYS